MKFNLLLCCAGIADGVGGWSQVNIDSGVYSRMLMQTAKAAATITPLSPIAPQIVLEEAHKKTNVKVCCLKPFLRSCLLAMKPVSQCVSYKAQERCIMKHQFIPALTALIVGAVLTVQHHDSRRT